MTASFGRRTQGGPARAPVPKKSFRPAPASAPAAPATPAVDDEIREWKKSRGFSFPVKTLALVASLSFGIGSFALPESVNDWMQWPLYALSAASLYIGFRRKR